jgi:hypothetical protein
LTNLIPQNQGVARHVAAADRHQDRRVRQREAEREYGRQRLLPAPDWIIELGIGRTPTQLHACDCYAAGKRRRPVDRDEARRLLRSGLPTCSHCSPDQHLGISE